MSPLCTQDVAAPGHSTEGCGGSLPPQLPALKCVILEHEVLARGLAPLELPASGGAVGRHSVVRATRCCEHSTQRTSSWPCVSPGVCVCVLFFVLFEICPLKRLQKHDFGGHMQFKWQSEVIPLLNTPEPRRHLPCANGVFVMLLWHLLLL